MLIRKKQVGSRQRQVAFFSSLLWYEQFKSLFYLQIHVILRIKCKNLKEYYLFSLHFHSCVHTIACPIVKLFDFIINLSTIYNYNTQSICVILDISVIDMTSPSRHFWDCHGWKSRLSIVNLDCGRWKSGPFALSEASHL